MRNALVPLDGSTFSKQVLNSVCQLLEPKAFALTLLRVAPLPKSIQQLPPRPSVHHGWLRVGYESPRDEELARHPIYADQLWESLRARYSDELARDAHCLRERGFEVRLAVRFGEAAREISDFVRREAIDLVVMATHGRTGLGHTLLGSIAESVLRQVQVPVMMLRPEGTTLDGSLPLSPQGDSKTRPLRSSTAL